MPTFLGLAVIPQRGMDDQTQLPNDAGRVWSGAQVLNFGASPMSLKSDLSDNKPHVRTMSIRGDHISPQGIQLTPLQLKLARTALGLGMRDLAQAAHVATSTIMRFETGKGGMQTGTLDRLQAVLEQRGIIFIPADLTGSATIRLAKFAIQDESGKLLSKD